MIRIPDMQASWISGELSPSLSGRRDLAKYNSGAATLLNMLVHPQGGASNRPGTEYIGEAIGPSRLIPFTFSVTQAYGLEFSEYVLRVIKDGGFVLHDLVDSAVYKWTQSVTTPGEYHLERLAGGDPGLLEVTVVYEDGTEMTAGTVGSLAAGEWGWGDNDTLGYNTLYGKLTVGGDPDAQVDGYVQSIYQTTSPYAFADLAEVKYSQDADNLYLAHPSYPQKRLTRTDHDAWTFTTHTLSPSTSPPPDAGAQPSVTAAGNLREVYYRVARIAATGEESLPGSTVSTTVDEPWISGAWVEVFWNDLQSATYKWTQVGVTNEWYLELAAGGDPGLAEPVDVYSREATGSPKNTPQAMTPGTVTSLAAGEWDYALDPGATFSTIYVRIIGSGDPNAGAAGYLTYKAADDYEYAVYKSSRGFFGWVGSVSTPWLIDDNIDPDTSLGVQVEDDPFPGADDYPGAVGIFEQRLFWARTNNAPQTLFGSQSGLFGNASKSTPLRDTDAIDAAIYSRQVNEIRHLVPLKSLLVLTSGTEWTMSRGDNTDAVTPNSVRFDVQGYRGASQVPPLTIGNEVLFVQRGGKVVRGLAYAITAEGYTSDDYTVMSRHLFENRTITEWCYQQDPDSVVWCVCSDGVLLGLTYLREHEVWAWHRHTTEGRVESICYVEGDTSDDVYMVVNRTINGITKRYVELLKARLPDDEDVRGAWFVDSGLEYVAPEIVIIDATQADPVVVTTATAHGLANDDVVLISEVSGMTELNGNKYWVANKTADTFELNTYNGEDIDGTGFTAYTSSGVVQKGVTTLSGFDHLEGELLAVLADGNVIPGLTVSSGAITLPQAAFRVIGGMPYVSDLETMQLDVDSATATQSRKRKIGDVLFRMHNTRGGWVGPDADSLVEVKYREDEDYDEATRLFTGDKKQAIRQKWGYEGRVFVRQTDPLPITVLAIIPEMVVGG